MIRLWHGGAPGLRVGDRLVPDPTRNGHLVDGCPVCEARRIGVPLPEDDNNPERVYVTADREYARVFAAGWPLGTLYRVVVDVPLDERSNDAMPSWAVPEALIVSVYEKCVRLTPRQFRKLTRKDGGER